MWNPTGLVHDEVFQNLAEQKINSLCTTVTDDQQLKVNLTCFTSAGELNIFADDFNRLHDNNIFMNIWKHYFKCNANEPDLTIKGLYLSVWKPAFQECCKLLDDLCELTVELTRVDKFLNNCRHTLHGEIIGLATAVTAITAISFPGIGEAVKKIEDYWKLCMYQKDANIILNFKEALDLQGDFVIVETLANEVYNELCII